MPGPAEQAGASGRAAVGGAPPDGDPLVRVESLSNEAQGVARAGGKVLFIEGALPGERVRVRVARRRPRYDSGRAIEILEPAAERVTPRCRYFGVCGGCSLQHLRTEAQPAAKERWLRDALDRIGRVSPQHWLPALTGSGWGYRRRARLGARYVPGKGGVLVGFRERQHSHITPLESCETLDPALARVLPAIRELIGGLSRPDRLPQIELAAGDRGAALVFRHLEPLIDDDLARLRDFARAQGVQVYRQPGGPDSMVALWPEQPEELRYALPGAGIELAFGPADFIQINAGMNRKLVDQALAQLDPRPHERVLDLYCGLGNFSLPLARRAARVLGIEGEAGLVERARRNARHNRIANAEFIAADLAWVEGPDPWGAEMFDAWLLDPPRTGALAVVQRLGTGSGPGRILYVSCNPATLARDAAILVHTKGYRLTAAGLLDMFPQTAHAEALALFDRT